MGDFVVNASRVFFDDPSRIIAAIVSVIIVPTNRTALDQLDIFLLRLPVTRSITFNDFCGYSSTTHVTYIHSRSRPNVRA